MRGIRNFTASPVPPRTPPKADLYRLFSLTGRLPRQAVFILSFFISVLERHPFKLRVHVHGKLSALLGEAAHLYASRRSGAARADDRRIVDVDHTGLHLKAQLNGKIQIVGQYARRKAVLVIVRQLQGVRRVLRAEN